MEDEVRICISKLKNSKTPSPLDKILNEYIKATKEVLIPVYCKLFNCVLETGLIPQSWLEGFIVPIFKNKGDSKDPNNYRPITILSCLGKLFTSILNQRLTTYLDDNNIMDENQAGFRQGYSCSDQIFTLHFLVEILKKRRKKLFCAFIDFSQAFDNLWRVGLWHKLLQKSVDGKFFRVIYNMYQNIKSCISLQDKVSTSFKSEIGVRQGENLSPLLFSMYLNDLQTNLHINGSTGIELKDPIDLTMWLKLLVLLYADDTVIMSDSQEDFQNSLNYFYNYCKEWHLKINFNKTKIVIFGARQLQHFDFKIGNNGIEIQDHFRYLGITFSSNGSFLKARKHIVEQANKAMYLLFTKINNSDLPIDLILKLFDHTVLPILTYGCEVFGYENIDILERVHNNFLRKITSARKSTPMSFLYGELGRYPIQIVVKSRMISFWNRLITGKEQKLSLQIYKYAMNLPDNNFKWSNKVRDVLFSVGLHDLWNDQFNTNRRKINKEVKEKLIEQFVQTWRDDLQHSNKGRIYLSFKEKPEFENYFKTLSKLQYNRLFKFRTANHYLPVETGRYDGTPFEDRICTLCNTARVGTEEHYMLECPYFDQQRNEIYAQETISLRTTLGSSSVDMLKQTCKFTEIIMSKFRR